MVGLFLSSILKRSLTRGSIVQRAVKYSTSSKPHASYLSSLPKTATPWLMLPPDVNDRPNGPTDNYFNILDRSLVKLDRHQSHVLVPKNTTCIGTTQGWVTFTCDTDGSVYLIDPYTEGGAVKLPPFVGTHKGFPCTLVGNPLSDSFVLLNQQSYVRRGRYMYSTNRSELRWLRELSFGEPNASLVYSRKDCTVYNLQWQKESPVLNIYCWDVLSENAPKIVRKFSFTDQVVDGQRFLPSLMCPDPEITEICTHATETDLVVGDSDGSPEEPDLLLVIRHFNVDLDETSPAKTNKIDVIRIDLEKKKLESVKSIGDRLIFIGENSDPFILSTRDCPGLKSNSVYIAEDLGYYDLETKCVTPFLSLGDLSNIRPRVYWVAPRS